MIYQVFLKRQWLGFGLLGVIFTAKDALCFALHHARVQEPCLFALRVVAEPGQLRLSVGCTRSTRPGIAVSWIW